MKHLFRSLVVVVTIVSMALSFAPFALPAQAEFSFAHQSSGVVKVRIFEDNITNDFALVGQGTGFFITDEVAVTAAHVVLTSSADEVSEAVQHIVIEQENPADDNDPLRAFARVIAVDKDADLALLHVIPAPFDAPSKKQTFWQHHHFSIAQTESGIGEKVNIIGYPDIGNTEMTLTTGIISSEEKENGHSVFTSDAVVSNGNSGGPAINEAGEVIGVISQVQFSQTNNAQLTRIVSLTDLQSWVETHKGNLSDYHYSKSFYERYEAALASEVSPSASERTLQVNNPYYPAYSVTLPANYYSRVNGPTGGYYLFDENDENALTISMLASPIIIDQSALEANLRSIFGQDIKEGSARSEVISGYTGISYLEEGSAVRTYAFSMEDWLVFITDFEDNGLVDTFRIQKNIDNGANFTEYQDLLQGVRVKAPSGFYILDLAPNYYAIYHPNGLAESVYTITLIDEPFDEFVGEGPDDIAANPNVETTFNTIDTSRSDGRTAITKGLIGGVLPFAVGALEDKARERVMYVYGLSSDQHDTLSELDYLIDNASFGNTFNEPQLNVLELLLANDTNQQTIPPRLRTTTTEQPEESVVTPSQPTAPTQEGLAREDLLGYILLQVEAHGEAWYIDPASRERIYMKDGKAAFQVMRQYGLGITNADLNKITIGTDPAESNKCTSFAKTLAGKVLLQVEENGEAWYIYPKNCRRYSLGRPDEAYDIMRFLGLGALTSDIEAIRERSI